MKKCLLLLSAIIILVSFCGCTSSGEQSEVIVFIASSLNSAMGEIADNYMKDNPNVKIIINADSSGALYTQIREGASCDVFFPASEKQMDLLELDGLLLAGMREDVINNQLVIISKKGESTRVKGLMSLDLAESFALADGSVPAGKYTREAMVRAGILPEIEDPSSYTSAEISQALGGVEISEQSNVSKVLLAVVEESCQVGSTYYSDIYGYEDELEVLEYVSYELTGNVTYPVGRVVNPDASDIENEAADSFYQYILSEAAKNIFEKYYFDTNVRR